MTEEALHSDALKEQEEEDIVVEVLLLMFETVQSDSLRPYPVSPSPMFLFDDVDGISQSYLNWV